MKIKLHNSLAKACRNTFLFQNKISVTQAENELLLVYDIHDEQFFLGFENNEFKKLSGFGIPNDENKNYWWKWWKSTTYRWKELKS